tara:strand:+ start:615 stop:971 length:357 start_codon:yes stop_codon:yes gene_type:complete
MKEEIYKDIKFYIGQNAQENWDLLDKLFQLNPDYIWFHLNSFPSPYVIMESSIKELQTLYTESEIDEFLLVGATLCKENSKYKFLNDLKICYTSLKKLKKTNTIGEIIVKGKKKIIKL